MPSAAQVSAVAITLWIVLGLIVLAILAGIVGRLLVKRGLRKPLLVRVINRTSDRVIDAIKQPITVAMLDEVADVLQTGHYTRNIAAALQENRDQIKQMVSEKIKDDPTGSRITFVPFHDQLIELASDTTLRVILQILADPRTDELVSDLLRDNIGQIRQAIREK